MGDRVAALPRGRARVLIAGVGNVLRGDDGFGPAVVRELERAGGLAPGARVVEVGIGGLGLVHELMEGWDALVVIDAVSRGGPPGRLYVLEPEVPAVEAIDEAQRGRVAASLHELVPGNVLVVARALGILPDRVRIIGCEPAETEEFTTELSPPVARGVPEAVSAVRAIVSEWSREREPA